MARDADKRTDREQQQSIFRRTIQRGIEQRLLTLSADEAKITYHCARDFTTSFKNPEETVRASYFTELVLDYGYPPTRIDLEVPVPRRTPEDRADIVVHEDDERKAPYLIVECKKDGITDAEFKQAIEQAFGNAHSLRGKFAAVVAGTTKTAFDVAGFKQSEREKNVIADIPKKYGKTPKYRFLKGDTENDQKVVSREELIRALAKSHDTVWQGGKLAPTTAFDEVSKLLFCKLKDEKATKRGEPYQFQIGTHERAEEVYRRIAAIYQKAKQEDEEVFKEDIRLDPKVVYNVVEHLQGLAIGKIDLDTKGVAFEKFMEDFFKGKMGQFFTPREIIRFCVRMLNPSRDHLILDPACGSGGFLLNTMDAVRVFAEGNYDEREAWEHWHSFAQRNLYGIEINDQIARVCKMNMIIHDDGHTNVISTDALSPFAEIADIKRDFQPDRFDLILTNPPFGATVKSTEKDYLDAYTLGKDRKNQKTEILFIERCIQFVKPKTGRIAIVLPDGVLTNSSLQYVRDYLMERCQILAVVSLPQFAFSHFGAGVKSSLVFLRRKGDKERLDKYPIFMAIAEHIGYDATGRKDPLNDLNQTAEEYQVFSRHRHDYKGIEPSPTITARCYVINSAEAKRERIDPHYFQPEFRALTHRLRRTAHVTLGDAVTFSNEIWNQQDAFTGRFPYIEISDVDIETGEINNITYHDKKDAPSRARMIVRANDILVSLTRPHRGAIALVDKTKDGFIASTGFAVLRDLKTNKLTREFLLCLLRSEISLKQMLQRSSGGNYPAITEEELKRIALPTPSIEVQRRIVQQAKYRLSEAKKLRAEASRLIQQIRQEVRESLLGE